MTIRALGTLLWMAVLAGGCADGDDDSLRSATAMIEDLLPVDGCSHVVKIDDVSYAPDEASLTAILERELPSRATVEIRYRLTGKTGRVECGNAAGFAELPEITVVFP